MLATPLGPLAAQLSDANMDTKVHGLYLVRGCLSFFVWLAFVQFSAAVKARFGSGTAILLVLVTCCQFHFAFYMSRPLPNIFALAVVMCGYSAWLRRRYRLLIYSLAFAAVVFRCDILVLGAPIGVILLLLRRINFGSALLSGIQAVVLSLCLTVFIDSIFWKRWLWAEGEVLWFNTAENKSSEWGTQPWHWYFTSALPRAMLGTLPLMLLGIKPPLPSSLPPKISEWWQWIIQWDKEMAEILVPILVYVGLYSALPHKELRFIFPSLPILNMCAARGFTKVYNNRQKGLLPAFFMFGAVGLLFVTLAVSVVFTTASSLNYPGGYALRKLHDLHVHKESSITHDKVGTLLK